MTKKNSFCPEKRSKRAPLPALLCLAGALALPGVAWAGPDMSMRMADRFEQMDANGDDKVNREEFTNFFPDIRDSTFELIDENADGFIDRDEWLKFKVGHAKGMDGGSGMPPAGMGQGGKKGPGADGEPASGQNPGALLPGIKSEGKPGS